jgi:aminopeptidase N
MRQHSKFGLLAAIPALIIGCSTGPDGPPAPSTTPPPGTPAPGAPGAGDPYYPTDGNGGYDALGYRVGVGFDPATGRLDGDTTVVAMATQDLSRFHLDLRGFEVASVQVGGEPATFTREGAFELVVTPARPLPAGGTFETRVRYAGIPQAAKAGELGANGWQRSASGGAFVLGEPHSAAFWYPVNETPRDKATFHLTARVPEGWTVVSNGREEGTSSAGGWTTSVWNEPNPIASYLTTMAVDRFSLDRGTLPDGTPLLSAYAPGAESRRRVGERVPEVLDFLASRFGPYPQSAAGGVYLGARIGYSLETQTRPTYTQGADLLTVVHENAHQWFGDSVSVSSWADICLNECLASYAQWLWAEAKEGHDLDQRYRAAVDRYRHQRSFWEPRLYDMGPGQEFTGVYSKGVLAVHALRRRVGEEVFTRVLREWPALHRGGNAAWPEFEGFVAEAAGEDLRGFFGTWFRGTGIPAEADLYPGTLRE